MRIAFDATALYGRFGGIENAIWRLFQELAALDCDTSFLAYVPADAPEPPRELGKNWQWRRLPFRGAQKMRRIVWQQFQLPLQLKKDGADLLHALNYVMPLLAPIPTILTVQDLIVLNHARYATRANRLHYRAMMPQSLQRAARIIVTTEKVGNEVARRVEKQKIRVVPLGVEPIFHQPVSPEKLELVREKYDLPARFGLFVGNFEPKKNLPNLLKALEIADAAPPLVIAGGVRPWPGHENFLTRAKLLGYVERDELPALFSMCEMFLFPSLSEGFGLPVLEALSCGAAVVASREVPLPNLENVALLANPHEPNSIANCISQLGSNAKLRTEMGERGRIYGREFSWRRTAEKTLAVYRELEKIF